MANYILLSGGSGKRLWPLSDETISKQFLKVLKYKNKPESMLQRTIRMIKASDPKANIVISTNIKQKKIIKEQAGDFIDIVVEKERRNTYPAILLATSYLYSRKNVNLDDVAIVLPVDAYADKGFYKTLLKLIKIVKENRNGISLIGVKPKYPSSKYGYIICDGKRSKVVKKFIEKPSEKKATQLIKTKKAYWNAGVFAFELNYILEKSGKEVNRRIYKEIQKDFDSYDATSFDYKVVEKEKNINMLEYNGNWEDLGTWSEFSKKIDYNMTNTTSYKNTKTTVLNTTKKKVVTIGLNNVIAVITEDGILVSNKNKCNDLKNIFD